MADDDANDSKALTGGDITRYRAPVARISYLSQDRPDLKFASIQVCCAMARPSVRDMDHVKRIGRYVSRTPRAKCWFRWQQSGELEAYSDADWRGDQTTRRSVSARVIMRRTLPEGVDHETASGVAVHRRERAVRCSQNCIRRAWDPERGKGFGITCGLNLQLDALATMCLVNRRGLGKSKHIDMQNLWIQEGCKSGRFVTKKVGTSVNPADLLTKPLRKPKNEQLMNIGLRVHENRGGRCCSVDRREHDGVSDLRACCRLREVDWRHQCSSNEFDDV